MPEMAAGVGPSDDATQQRPERIVLEAERDGDGFSVATFSENLPLPQMHAKWEKLLSSVPLHG